MYKVTLLASWLTWMSCTRSSKQLERFRVRSPRPILNIVCRSGAPIQPGSPGQGRVNQHRSWALTTAAINSCQGPASIDWTCHQDGRLGFREREREMRERESSCKFTHDNYISHHALRKVRNLIQREREREAELLYLNNYDKAHSYIIGTTVELHFRANTVELCNSINSSCHLLQ